MAYATTLDSFAVNYNAPGVELVYTSHSSWPLPETSGDHGLSRRTLVTDRC